MSWVRLDDGFGRHHKVAGISDKAFRLHVCGLCESASQLLDGRIPKSLLTTLPNGGSKAAIKELVAAGLWVPDGEGFVIHDYLDWNPSGAAVRAKRDAAKERMLRVRSPDVRANRTRTDDECSREQDANEERTNGEVRAKFAECSLNPVPVPNPVEIQPGKSDPRPDTLRDARPSPEPACPAEVPCPADLALTDDALGNLAMAGIPEDLARMATAEFRAAWVGNGQTRTPRGWVDYLRVAVSKSLSNANKRAELRGRLDDTAAAAPTCASTLDPDDVWNQLEAL